MLAVTYTREPSADSEGLEIHPDTMRLMLTGHADMQTAIDAINQGEIYRFLTKPWDDTELKVMLHLALERLDLERENRRLMAMVSEQRMDLTPLITHRFALDDIHEAYELFSRQGDRVMKVALFPAAMPDASRSTVIDALAHAGV